MEQDGDGERHRQDSGDEDWSLPVLSAEGGTEQVEPAEEQNYVKNEHRDLYPLSCFDRSGAERPAASTASAGGY